MKLNPKQWHEILSCLISSFMVLMRNYIQLCATKLWNYVASDRLERFAATEKEIFPIFTARNVRARLSTSPIVTSSHAKQSRFMQFAVKWFILITFHVFPSSCLQVRDLVEKCTCPSQFPMIRVSEGKYRIGDTKVLIFVRVSQLETSLLIIIPMIYGETFSLQLFASICCIAG